MRIRMQYTNVDKLEFSAYLLNTRLKKNSCASLFEDNTLLIADFQGVFFHLVLRFAIVCHEWWEKQQNESCY